MTDTIESLGRELDAAELAAHGKIEGPSWPATLAEWVRNRTPFGSLAFPPYMLPFRERIRALLDAPRKPRLTRAELRAEARRLKRRVNGLVRKVRALESTEPRLAMSALDVISRDLRSILDADACETIAEAALRVVNARVAAMNERDAANAVAADAMRVGLEECERLRGDLASGQEVHDRNRERMEKLRAELDAAVERYERAEAHVLECDERADGDREDWLALHAKYEAAMGVVEAARPFVPPGIESKPVDIGRPSGYRRLAAAIHAFDARSTSTCPFADDACAGGDPCAKPENVGTWSEELWRGKAQWRCGCGADAGNLRVYGAERCGGCAWKRPEVKGGA